MQLAAWLPTDKHDIIVIALQECPKSKSKQWFKAIRDHLGARPLGGVGFFSEHTNAASNAARRASTLFSGSGAGRGAGAGAVHGDEDAPADVDDSNDAVVSLSDLADGDSFEDQPTDDRPTTGSILSLSTARVSLADAEVGNRDYAEATGGYRTVTTVSLWGIHVMALVKTELAPRITDVRVPHVWLLAVTTPQMLTGPRSCLFYCRCTRTRSPRASPTWRATRVRAVCP